MRIARQRWEATREERIESAWYHARDTLLGMNRHTQDITAGLELLTKSASHDRHPEALNLYTCIEHLIRVEVMTTPNMYHVYRPKRPASGLCRVCAFRCLSTLTQNGPALFFAAMFSQSDVQDMQILYANDHENAVHRFNNVYRQIGNSNDNWECAHTLENFDNFKKVQKKRRELLRQSAALGYGPAMTMEVCMENDIFQDETMRDFTTVIKEEKYQKRLQIAAKLGDPFAMEILGLYTIREVPKDEKRIGIYADDETTAYLERAARLGRVSACRAWGFNYPQSDYRRWFFWGWSIQFMDGVNDDEVSGALRRVYNLILRHNLFSTPLIYVIGETFDGSIPLDLETSGMRFFHWLKASRETYVASNVIVDTYKLRRSNISAAVRAWTKVAHLLNKNKVNHDMRRMIGKMIWRARYHWVPAKNIPEATRKRVKMTNMEEDEEE